jgi:hypothetical protein
MAGEFEGVHQLGGAIAQLIALPFRLIAGIFGLRRRQLSPDEMNRRRAAVAAFVGVFGVYLIETGGWPLDQLPPWMPSALIAAAAVSALLVAASVLGARERDPSGVVVSLVIAGGGYALLRWQWYVPRDYFGAGYVPAALINRFLPGVYIGTVAAGVVRAVVCLLPLGRQGQRNLYEIARIRSFVAAFVLIFALYVLFTGQWLGPLIGPLAAWAPTGLIVIAGVSLLVLLPGLYTAHKTPLRDPHGVGMSLAVAAVALAALWGQWQVPPGPASEVVNRLLPGLYLAALIAALVWAAISAQLHGGAGRIVEWWRRRRNRPMRPASSGSGFWAEMREAFERGRTGRT